MRSTYDVWDDELKKTVYKDMRAKEVFQKIGLTKNNVSRYSETGYLYKGKYRISACEESTRLDGLVSVYDFPEGVFIMEDVFPNQVVEYFGFSNESRVAQYISMKQLIKGRYYIFRSADIPARLILPEELEREWNHIRFILNPRAKEGKAGYDL